MWRAITALLTMVLLAACQSPSDAPDDPAPGAGPEAGTPPASLSENGVRPTDKTLTAHARHAFTIDVPAGAGQLRAWFAMPNDGDQAQTVRDWQVQAPYPTSIVRDSHGNNFLYMEADDPKPGTVEVVTTFTVERHEVAADLDASKTRPHTQAELEALDQYLQPSSQSPITDAIRAKASEAVGDETNPILAARLLYDAVLGHMEYHVKDPKPNAEKTMGSTGTGNSVKAFETCTGNCTDFHSLYAAMARSQNIPTRVVYGSFFKGPLDGVDKDQSYHCWVEFHAPGVGWIPLDVAVADVFVADFAANEHSRPRAILTVADGYEGPDARLVDYYFGNIDERRVTWHWNRDLVMPGQQGEPLLWNPKAYVEIDGKPHKSGRKLTYRSDR